jgi:superfamily II DNA or RNA helicase
MEYKFNPYVLASSTKINIFPHQIDEVIKILDNPRMMIADEVWLGKTIIAALVATELRERGLAYRTLFVVPKSLVVKWKDELSSRFETESQIIDSDYLKTHGNPFENETFSYIASMDFLKQKHVMELINDHRFDLVVVDEAHKFSYGTDRFSLGQLIANRADFLLFLTATPHNGDKEDFLQRMRLLDPYYYDQVSTTSHLMTRNIKEDVIDLDGKEVFPPRESNSIDVPISEKEIKLHRMVDEYIAERLDEASNAEDRNTMSLERRNDKLGTAVDVQYTIREIRRSEDDNDEETSERNEEKLIGFTLHKNSSRLSKEKTEISDILTELENLQQVDSKLNLLIDSIETMKKTDPHAKLVVFTEYRDTMNYLMKNLKYKVEHIDGTMSIQERNDALTKFNYINGPEIMICTDAAGEGIDMQYRG